MPKSINKNYDVIINGENFFDQPIDSDIKRYKKIRKLTTRQGEWRSDRRMYVGLWLHQKP